MEQGSAVAQFDALQDGPPCCFSAGKQLSSIDSSFREPGKGGRSESGQTLLGSLVVKNLGRKARGVCIRGKLP